jgi:hypothetical protein
VVADAEVVDARPGRPRERLAALLDATRELVQRRERSYARRRRHRAPA